MSKNQIITSAAGEHPVLDLCGWGGVERPDLVQEAFEMWSSRPKGIMALPPVEAGGRSMLWEVGRKIFGVDSPNYAQQVGDCVSFGGKNACEYVQYFPIANGARNVWTRVYPPYLYGCGRIFIGKGQLGGGDGSLGAWQADAVVKYGTIPIDAPNCPPYSGSVARSWGSRQGPPQEFIPIGKKHLVKTTSPITTWEELGTALTNGYPVTIASNVGFDMKTSSDGFHHYTTSWGHQMCCVGFDDDPSDPYGCILNSWGNVHGQVKDFKTGETWPEGTLRVRKKDIVTMLNANDSFAYSSTDLFVAQELPEEAFNIW